MIIGIQTKSRTMHTHTQNKGTQNDRKREKSEQQQQKPMHTSSIVTKVEKNRNGAALNVEREYVCVYVALSVYLGNGEVFVENHHMRVRSSNVTKCYHFSPTLCVGWCAEMLSSRGCFSYSIRLLAFGLSAVHHPYPCSGAHHCHCMRSLCITISNG